jgi:hypothetical protein
MLIEFHREDVRTTLRQQIYKLSIQLIVKVDTRRRVDVAPCSHGEVIDCLSCSRRK